MFYFYLFCKLLKIYSLIRIDSSFDERFSKISLHYHKTVVSKKAIQNAECSQFREEVSDFSNMSMYILQGKILFFSDARVISVDWCFQQVCHSDCPRQDYTFSKLFPCNTQDLLVEICCFILRNDNTATVK